VRNFIRPSPQYSLSSPHSPTSSSFSISEFDDLLMQESDMS
jgi:hypothetical protein